MAMLSELEARVQDIVIDLHPKALARIIPEIRQAQVELEDSHGFLDMEAEHEFIALPGIRSNITYQKPVRFLRVRTDVRPVRKDGRGDLTEIEWLMSWNNRVRLYSEDPADTGPVAHVYERTDDFELFPYPDASAPGGTLFSDGNWRIIIPYFQRKETLSTAGQSNWFSVNADEYLVQQAAGKVLALNRDREESLLALTAARAEKDRVILRDKKLRLAKQRLLRPRTGARGSAFSSRTFR